MNKTALIGFGVAISLVAGRGAVRAEPEYRTVVSEEGMEQRGFESAGQRFRIDPDKRQGAVAGDVPELLDGAPGVVVQRTNRAAAAPIVRGFVGIDNLLTLDGVRLNLAIWRTGPLQYGALIDPLILSEVQLLSGPSGVLHGSGAVGGVIEHTSLPIAPDGEGRPSARLRLQADSADSGALGHGAVHYGNEDFAGWTAFGLRVAGDLRHGGGAGLPGDYQQYRWATRNRVRLGRDFRLVGALFGTQTNGARRVDTLARGTLRTSDNTEQLAYLRLEHRANNPASAVLQGFSTLLSLRHMREDESQYRCRREASGRVTNLLACGRAEEQEITGKQRWVDDVVALAADVDAEWAPIGERLTLTTLAGLRGEWIGSSRPDEDGASPRFSDGSRWLAGHAAVAFEARVIGDATSDVPGPAKGNRGNEEPWTVKLDGGVRFETMRATAPDVPGLGEVDVAFSGLGASLRALAAHEQQMALWVGWNRGFRAPNLQESIVVGDTGQTFEIPNGGLRPQQADGFEVGLRLRDPEAVFELAFVAFATIIDGAITRVPATWEGQTSIDGKEVGQRVNADKAQHRGVEVTGRLRFRGWLDGVVLDAATTWLDGDVETRDGASDVIRRLSPWHGRLGLRWEGEDGRWRVGGAFRWSAAQRRLAREDRSDIRICANASSPWLIADPCPGTDGWSDLQLYATFRPRPEVGLTLQIDNVFDQAYRVHGSGLDAPGFNARLGLDLRL